MSSSHNGKTGELTLVCKPGIIWFVGECTKCGGSGPFEVSHKNPTGFSRRCKACATKNAREWARNNAKQTGEDPPLPAGKLCTQCGCGGPFYRQKGTKDGWTHKCVECCKKDPSRQPAALRARAKSRRLKNPEKAKAKDAVERVKYADRRKANWDLWAYGLAPGERQAMVEAQGGKCAICAEALKPTRTDVDHDHVTKKVRGILCRLCNSMLGHFKDDPLRLELAIQYLTRPPLILSAFDAAVGGNDWTSKEGRAAYQIRHRMLIQYGLSWGQYLWLEAEQEHKCAVCRDPLPGGKARHVDHNHTTGVVRGLLCGSCNVGLGQARDQVNVLMAAISYLGLIT